MIAPSRHARENNVGIQGRRLLTQFLAILLKRLSWESRYLHLMGVVSLSNQTSEDLRGLNSPGTTSHSRIVPSHEPETIWEPSGEIAAA